MSERASGLGQPGQRVVRHETAESDLYRVLKTVFWLSVLLVAFVLLTFGNALLVGPLTVFWLGEGVILIVFAWRLRCALVDRDQRRQAILVALFVLVLVAWAFIGYEWLEGEWPPLRVTWPQWVKVPLLTISVCLQFAIGWGAWRLWTEIIDPTGPTSPRIAIPRDKLVTPWGLETYGGSILPLQPTPQPQPKPRVLEVTLSERGGRTQGIAHVPDLPGLPALARHLAGGGAPSERMANKHGRYSRRQWIETRDLCLARGWMAWKNGEKRTGLYCTRQGLAVMRHVAKLTPVRRPA